MRNMLIALLLLTALCCSQDKENSLLIKNDQVEIRETPGPRGKILRHLRQDEKVTDQGAVSDFFTPIQLADSSLESPWIQVRCSDGARGWLLAIQAQPLAGQAADWLQEKDMLALLRPELMSAYRGWRAAGRQLDQAPQLLGWYRSTRSFQEQLLHRLQARPERNDADYHPQFYWLQPQLPGLVLMWPRPDESPVPYLDYRYFARKAALTAGSDDDLFFRFCIRLFPADSVASELPVWVMPVSTLESYSQLGTGIHAELLHEIDSLATLAPAYGNDWLDWKDQLLRDFLDKDRAFWQAPDKISAELDAILQNPPHCLSERDLLAIRERRRMFDDPVANHIRVNLRSGN